MRISDWSSDVCSSDLDRLAQLAGDATLLAVRIAAQRVQAAEARRLRRLLHRVHQCVLGLEQVLERQPHAGEQLQQQQAPEPGRQLAHHLPASNRSEEHTSELQPLMRISYAVFCLKKKKTTHTSTET